MYYHFLFLHKTQFLNFIMFLYFSNFLMFLYFLTIFLPLKCKIIKRKFDNTILIALSRYSFYANCAPNYMKSSKFPHDLQHIDFYSLKTVFQSGESNHVCSAVRVSAYSINIYSNKNKTNIFLVFTFFKFLGF